MEWALKSCTKIVIDWTQRWEKYRLIMKSLKMMATKNGKLIENDYNVFPFLLLILEVLYVNSFKIILYILRWYV